MIYGYFRHKIVWSTWLLCSFSAYCLSLNLYCILINMVWFATSLPLQCTNCIHSEGPVQVSTGLGYKITAKYELLIMTIRDLVRTLRQSVSLVWSRK